MRPELYLRGVAFGASRDACPFPFPTPDPYSRATPSVRRRPPPSQTSVSDPYEDFDQLHDRDHFSAATVELDCRTPGGMFNFCRPRSGTVYESAKGAGPGFFSEAPAATGASRQEQDGASPVEGLSDAHQGCTIS